MGRFGLNPTVDQRLIRCMSSFSEFVVQGGQSITAGQVDSFRGHLAAYKLKAELLKTERQPLLADQCAFLLRYIEDVLDDAYVPGDFHALPEAIFAVRYLVKGVDIIPDNLPGGYTDDAAVLREVLIGHEPEFREFSAESKIDFDALQVGE
jgi:uncharacterized membrane protein YkvA (DUF1232 family)